MSSGSHSISDSSILDGGLFPRMKPSDDTSEHDPFSTISDHQRDDNTSDSINNLRTIFPSATHPKAGSSHSIGQDHVFHTVFDTASDFRSTGSYAIDDESREEPSKLSRGFLGGDEHVDPSNMMDLLSDLADEHVSLNSSILRSIDKEGLTLETSIEAENKKFPFLARYLDAYKKRHPDDRSSVFGISQLDDFHKYAKKSEIDDAIDQRIKQNRLDNLLSIVKSNDLADNFYSVQSPEKKTTYFKEPWKLRLPWNSEKEKVYVDDSDISELRIAGNSYTSYSSSTQGSQFLQRKLKVRHLQMISFGGTLGVGLYLNSGKAFTIAGGFGTLLAFAIVGLIVLATIISFCEMVTFVSVVDGVSGLSSRFVEELFGFATGWLYFLSFSVGLAGEVVASVIILSYFPNTKVLTNAGATAGFVTLFLSFCIISNLLDVRVFGEIEYVSSIIKVIMTLIMIIVMIVINRGGLGDQGVIGFRYWQELKSLFDHNMIFGMFRPSFDLSSTGMDSKTTGVGGNWGRFLSVLTAMVIVTYSYSGTEIVCIAACEAKNPRKALPSATKRVFWRILIFYCLASFVISLNIYAGDPRLLRYYSGLSGVPPEEFDHNFAIQYLGGNSCKSHYAVFAGFANGSQSPWTVALQSAGLCNWSAVATASLAFFAFSCGNSQLYVSSRTIYSLALQHKAPAFLKKCNRFGIPYNAVLVASMAAFSSYICVSQLATVVFQNLTSMISSSGVFVWFAMCLSYVRFYYGLKKRPDIVSRDDKSYPYRSPFQPYCAIFGLIGSGVMILSMCFVVFMKGYWNTLFFFSSYGSLMIFAILYLGYKLTKGTRILSLEALDFDSGRRETDIYVWDGGKEFNRRNLKDWAHRIVHFMA